MSKATRVLIFFVAVLLPSCACEPSPLEDIAVSGDARFTNPTSTTHPDMVGLATTKQELVLISPTTTTTSPPPPPSTTTTTAVVVEESPPPASTSPPTPTGDIWWKLAGCETGYKYDNPNTGNGYYGYFQFSLPTWQGVGGPGYPHHHSYETQLHYAKILQARDGWAPWPACSRKLGLR